MGNCPRGEMEYFAMNHSLAGYEDCKTIQILYHIQSGIQGDEHPHPGKRYSTRGFPRIGYLPDNEKGRKVSMAFVCVEVLRPSQPNGVMSSAISLPNHTFTGQA